MQFKPFSKLASLGFVDAPLILNLIHRYRHEDFTLRSGVDIFSINTVVEKSDAHTGEDVENILFTHWEEAHLNYKENTPIIYNRLNHIKFKYKMKLINKENSQGHVIIRIFLGLLKSK